MGKLDTLKYRTQWEKALNMFSRDRSYCREMYEMDVSTSIKRKSKGITQNSVFKPSKTFVVVQLLTPTTNDAGEPPPSLLRAHHRVVAKIAVFIYLYILV